MHRPASIVGHAHQFKDYFRPDLLCRNVLSHPEILQSPLRMRQGRRTKLRSQRFSDKTGITL
jgi:hypothetical protein